MVNSINDGLGIPDVIASGNSVQAGEFVASTGSVVDVSFGTAFSSAPIVVATIVGGTANQISASAGSFVVNTVTASASGTYIAFNGN